MPLAVKTTPSAALQNTRARASGAFGWLPSSIRSASGAASTAARSPAAAASRWAAAASSSAIVARRLASSRFSWSERA